MTGQPVNTYGFQKSRHFHYIQSNSNISCHLLLHSEVKLLGTFNYHNTYPKLKVGKEKSSIQ